MITPKKLFYSTPDEKPKVLAPIFAAVPASIRGLDRWVLWRLVWSEEKRKWDKPPYQATGFKAKSNDASTWTTFDEAVAAYATGQFDGIGIELGAGYCGVDLDNCRDPRTGEFSLWVREILDDCDIYAEVSPSGTGAKIFGLGEWTGGWHKAKTEDGGEIEVYDSGRYFTVTGHNLNEHDLGDATDLLARIDLKYRPKKETPAPAKPPKSESTRMPIDVEGVLRKAASANGEPFSRLWTGHTSGHEGDASSAELALCNYLAFWFGPEVQRIDGMFRRSGLYANDGRAKKWDAIHSANGRTYGQMTIGKALAGRTEFYTASGHRATFGENGSTQWQTPGTSDTPKEDAQHRFEFIDDVNFADGDYRPKWLIKGVLVQGEPGIIAGPEKSMKTSTAVDLAISLAYGSPFLNRFEVPRQVKVAIVSGESGPSTLQATGKRIIESKGLLREPNRIHWCFEVPVLSDLASMSAFVEKLIALGVEVAILDPMYLMLGDVDARSMFEVGRVLRIVGTMFLSKGITPIFLHHSNRSLEVGAVMEFSHLAYAGFSQYFRQFTLLNRRRAYQQDGVHELWARIGGSAGHGGLYAIDINEGILNNHDFTGRHWNVEVFDKSDVKNGVNREEKKQDGVREKIRKDENAVLEIIDAEVAKKEGGITIGLLRKTLGMEESKIKKILTGLGEEGKVEPHSWYKKDAGRKVDGYRRKSEEHQPSFTDGSGGCGSVDGGGVEGESSTPTDPPSGLSDGACGGGVEGLSPCKGDIHTSSTPPEPRKSKTRRTAKKKTPKKKSKPKKITV